MSPVSPVLSMRSVLAFSVSALMLSVPAAAPAMARFLVHGMFAVHVLRGLVPNMRSVAFCSVAVLMLSVPARVASMSGSIVHLMLAVHVLRRLVPPMVPGLRHRLPCEQAKRNACRGDAEQHRWQPKTKLVVHPSGPPRINETFPVLHLPLPPLDTGMRGPLFFLASRCDVLGRASSAMV